MGVTVVPQVRLEHSTGEACRYRARFDRAAAEAEFLARALLRDSPGAGSDSDRACPPHAASDPDRGENFSVSWPVDHRARSPGLTRTRRSDLGLGSLASC